MGVEVSRIIRKLLVPQYDSHAVWSLIPKLNEFYGCHTVDERRLCDEGGKVPNDGTITHDSLEND